MCEWMCKSRRLCLGHCRLGEIGRGLEVERLEVELEVE
jgi:hypothetical protein